MNEQQYKSIFEMAQDILGDESVQSQAQLFKIFGEAVENYINLKINDLRNEFNSPTIYKE